MSGVVLVTGGLGFLGSHLVETLVARGARVRVLDDLSNAPAWRVAEAAALGAEVQIGSVLDARALAEAMRGVVAVHHLAAIVGVRRVAADPEGVLRANGAGAAAMIAACEARGARLLFVSSSEVYGDGAAGRRFLEDDAPGFAAARVATDGRAAYALSKWIGERMALEASTRGLAVVVARPFNAVGAGQSESSGAVVPRFAAAALRGEPIEVEGDGSATRAFACASDVARAFAGLLSEDRARGSVVNVGSDRRMSVLDLARAVRDLCGSRSPIVRRAPLAAGVAPIAHRAPDLARLRALLGSALELPVEEGLRAAVASQRRAASAACVVA